MAIKFSNNASAELASALTADATTLTVREGYGEKFPSLSEGDYFYVTLVGDSTMEIVKVTATSGDTFTIVRAQDNTEALEFYEGDLIELRITAATFSDITTEFSNLDTKINVDITNSINTLNQSLSQDLTDLDTKLTGDISTLNTNLSNTITNAVPTGTVIAFAANNIPSGYLLCNGAVISRSTYATLFDAIGTTYGSGDGSTTFALPNLVNRFIQGSETAGIVKEAGLPDHKHLFTHTQSYYYNYQGTTAFHTTEFQVDGNAEKQFPDAMVSGIGNASGSNGIYGKSSTVQPPALTMCYYIKY